MEAIQPVAALIATTHGVYWMLTSKWERPRDSDRLREALSTPPLFARAGYAAFLFALAYPVVVAIAPAWAYEGPLNWSSAFDTTLQALAIFLWAVAMGILLWASAVIGRYAGIDGVLEGQELVDRGPYRRVRHPIYGCFAVITLALALMFRSYLLLAALALWLVAGRWAAKAEEALLSATLGEQYDAYRRRTGRFVPRSTWLSGITKFGQPRSR